MFECWASRGSIGSGCLRPRWLREHCLFELSRGFRTNTQHAHPTQIQRAPHHTRFPSKSTMAFCRRCGDIVSGDRCAKCGGSAVGMFLLGSQFKHKPTRVDLSIVLPQLPPCALGTPPMLLLRPLKRVVRSENGSFLLNAVMTGGAHRTTRTQFSLQFSKLILHRNSHQPQNFFA